MMKVNYIKPLLILSYIIMLGISLDANASSKYGFAFSIKPCPLWTTFFPLSFQVPDDKGTRNASPQFNIIYISGDTVKHMDDYYDLYLPGNVRVWPERPFLINGKDTAICLSSGQCVTSGYGSVGKGISAYNNIVAEFPDDKVKVLSDSAYGNGDITWIFLPLRKLKLLRIEYFTPYTGRESIHFGYVEPLFFEYRSTGNGDEMQLKSKGGTARGGDYSRVKLPEKIKFTSLSAIQIWLEREGGAAYQDLLPAAATVNFTQQQLALVPENCQ